MNGLSCCRNRLPRGEDRKRREERRQKNQKQADAVDAQVVADPVGRGLDPGDGSPRTACPRRSVEVVNEVQGKHESAEGARRRKRLIAFSACRGNSRSRTAAAAGR